jgi:hypothetical protein
VVLAFVGNAAQAQRQPGGGFMGGGFPVNLRAMLAQSKPLQEELKMSEEQVTAFADFSKKQQEAMGFGGGRGGFGGGMGGFGGFGGGMGGFGGGMGGFGAAASDEEQVERLKTQIKQIEERIAFTKKTLSSEQMSRLEQIERQQLGLNAFFNKKVAEELKFTDDQKAEFKKINEDMQTELREMAREAFGGGGMGFNREKFQEMQKKSQEIQDDAKAKMGKVLTDAQFDKWKTMLGEPFDTSKLFQRPMRQDN